MSILFSIFIFLGAACATVVQLPAQQLLWQDRYRPAGGFALANGLSLGGNCLVVVGADSSSGSTDGLVRAYNANTGKILWEARIDKSGKYDVAQATVADDRRVFVGGATQNSVGNRDLFVQVFDIRKGTLVWEDVYDRAGRNDEISQRTMALSEGRVFAGGLARKSSGGADWLVRAYDIENGSLLWQDMYDGGSFDHTVSLDANDAYVVASGVTTDVDTIRHFTIRAYDATSGTLLWQDSPAGRKGFFFATDVAWQVALNHDQVFAAGSIGDSAAIRFVARSYDAKNGKLQWSDLVNKGAGSDVAFSLAQDTDRVIVAGSGGTRCNPAAESDCDILIRAYNIQSGALVWERQLDKFGADDRPIDIATSGNRVIEVGQANDTTGKTHWIVQVFDARDGSTVWEDEVNEPGGNAYPLDVDVRNGKAFVAGFTEDAAGKTSWLVRVYNLSE